jgi:predicted acylesterase/phospholipase RssA
MTDALILSGGVAKGAFTAGVLSMLFSSEAKAAARVDVHSLVGASSGALNAAFAASVLHTGTEERDIARLSWLWLEDASFGRVFEPTFAGIFELRGASGENKVMELLRSAIRPAPAVRSIELRLVVANLAGNIEQVGGAPATTYENVLEFGSSMFESAEQLEGMFRAVTASAAFPGAFVPVPLEIDGRTSLCIDGGAVNNTPLRYALEHPLGIDRVFVVTPQPRVATESLHGVKGLGLITHLADMLVEERLFRDLRAAYAMNDALLGLERTIVDPELRARVLETLGWGGRRPVEIVEIRPESPLPGDVFDGFFSRELREEYVRSGEDAARRWIERVVTPAASAPDSAGT